ncbi:MAG: DUF3418 domain-containing protein, partial [Povalibacter sp.]
ECFLQPGATLPRSAAAFQALIDQKRAEFGAQVDRLATQVVDVLREVRGVREKLRGLTNPAFKSVAEDASAQLAELIPEGFPMDVPSLLWPHLARYLKALLRRLDKVPGNFKRDAELVNRVAPFAKAFRELKARSHAHTDRIELEKLQWMIEEFRVSLFAQDLRTVTPVSDKRLADQLELARVESRKI